MNNYQIKGFHQLNEWVIEYLKNHTDYVNDDYSKSYLLLDFYKTEPFQNFLNTIKDNPNYLMVVIDWFYQIDKPTFQPLFKIHNNEIADSVSSTENNNAVKPMLLFKDFLINHVLQSHDFLYYTDPFNLIFSLQKKEIQEIILKNSDISQELKDEVMLLIRSAGTLNGLFNIIEKLSVDEFLLMNFFEQVIQNSTEFPFTFESYYSANRDEWVDDWDLTELDETFDYHGYDNRSECLDNTSYHISVNKEFLDCFNDCKFNDLNLYRNHNHNKFDLNTIDIDFYDLLLAIIQTIVFTNNDNQEKYNSLKFIINLNTQYDDFAINYANSEYINIIRYDNL